MKGTPITTTHVRACIYEKINPFLALKNDIEMLYIINTLCNWYHTYHSYRKHYQKFTINNELRFLTKIAIFVLQSEKVKHFY